MQKNTFFAEGDVLNQPSIALNLQVCQCNYLLYFPGSSSILFYMRVEVHCLILRQIKLLLLLKTLSGVVLEHTDKRMSPYKKMVPLINSGLLQHLQVYKSNCLFFLSGSSNNLFPFSGPSNKLSCRWTEMHYLNYRGIRLILFLKALSGVVQQLRGKIIPPWRKVEGATKSRIALASSNVPFVVTTQATISPARGLRCTASS